VVGIASGGVVPAALVARVCMKYPPMPLRLASGHRAGNAVDETLESHQPSGVWINQFLCLQTPYRHENNPAFLSLAVLTIAFVAPAQAQKVNPKPISTPSPAYPQELIEAGVGFAGQAVITFTVKADGTVGDAVVTAADQPIFGKAAQETVLSWKFQPGTVDGCRSSAGEPVVQVSGAF